MTTLQFIVFVTLAILIVGAILLIPWLVRTYNRLIQGKNRVNEVWSNIEVMLHRRHELVPNLVSTVKGYAKHEDQVFTEVTQARSNAVKAKTPSEHADSERQLSLGLNSLYAVAESYPDLKANENFLSLQNELVSVEDSIQEARTQYNQVVRRFNTFIQSFPQNLISGILGFKAFDYYDAPGAAQEPISAEF